jgi:hypothetical protein
VGCGSSRAGSCSDDARPLRHPSRSRTARRNAEPGAQGVALRRSGAREQRRIVARFAGDHAGDASSRSRGSPARGEAADRARSPTPSRVRTRGRTEADRALLLRRRGARARQPGRAGRRAGLRLLRGRLPQVDVRAARHGRGVGAAGAWAMASPTIRRSTWRRGPRRRISRRARGR